MKLPIVFPYVADEAQGNELELAVTGWRKYFIGNYHIYIVGDSHPIVSSGDDITFVGCPRVGPKPGQYLPHLDLANKFRAVTTFLLAQGTPRFVFTCDDIYPVNYFSGIEVFLPKVMGKMSEEGDDVTSGFWGDYQKTRRECVERGFPTWDYTTHTPIYFNAILLNMMFDEYDCLNKSYVIETLYHNSSFDGRIPYQLSDGDIFKYQIDDTHRLDPDGLERALKEKLWITNSHSGWSQELEDRLRKHYQSK